MNVGNQPVKPRCPKIILEGTRLTNKTDIAFALNEHPRIVGRRKYQYHSPIISAEWGSFNNSAWGRGPINFAPEEEAQAMAVYETWARMFELQRYYSWIIDRFHISTRAYQHREYGKDYDFHWLEERLLPPGFVIIFCTRSPDSFEVAREARLKISGNPSQYDDLSIFIEEQDLMRKLLKDSILPICHLPIDGMDIEDAVDRIADWMEAGDHIYLD